jgi:vacuolar-type H+-ATPase subunit C/Vma6
MYASLLSAQDFARLSEALDLPTLVTQLKQTAYGPYLEALKEKDLTPQKVDLAIKGRLADSYYSVIHMAPVHARSLLKQLYQYYGVGGHGALLICAWVGVEGPDVGSQTRRGRPQACATALGLRIHC